MENISEVKENHNIFLVCVRYYQAITVVMETGMTENTFVKCKYSFLDDYVNILFYNIL